MRLTYIKPCLAVPRSTPPSGARWAAELKFDGYRVQWHQGPGGTRLFSRGGHDFTGRFAALADALPQARKAAVIDGELVSLDANGFPQFAALHRRLSGHHVLFVFDLLVHGGVDIRAWPLSKRRTSLEALVMRSRCPNLAFSESFTDPHALLSACEAHGMEGIVVKRQDEGYHSGRWKGWVKVKTNSWRAANRERHHLFQASTSARRRGS